MKMKYFIDKYPLYDQPNVDKSSKYRLPNDRENIVLSSTTLLSRERCSELSSRQLEVSLIAL